jgi:hypothetical protein
VREVRRATLPGAMTPDSDNRQPTAVEIRNLLVLMLVGLVVVAYVLGCFVAILRWALLY